MSFESRASVRNTLLAVSVLLIVLTGNAAFANPTVSNVSFTQKAGTKLIEILYDLSENASSVSVLASSDGGVKFDIPVWTLSGSAGLNVTAGTSKKITWNAGMDWQGHLANNAKIRVSASAEPLFTKAAGTYSRGAGQTNFPNSADAPRQSIVISRAYYVRSYLTTKAQWDAVAAWGAAHGYTDLATGAGKGVDHPVQMVTWYDVVKWCNALSEMEGLNPCYFLGNTIYKTGVSDSVVCDWDSKGYRLPTEAEYEVPLASVPYAGGYFFNNFLTPTYVTNNYFNFLSGSIYDPRWAIGGVPYTSPVGALPILNLSGLYDPAGNVQQWCWDWYGTYVAGTDPRGPTTGTKRVTRGGDWNSGPDFLNYWNRNSQTPNTATNTIGFRVARGNL